MKKIDLELEVGAAEIDDLRPVLAGAISNHFSEGVLRHQWDGDVLRLSGPGARGSLVYEGGRLKLEAKLKAPASWAHKVIRRKIDAAMGEVSTFVAERA